MMSRLPPTSATPCASPVATLERLAALDRPSASAGEHLAARMIGDHLRQQGARVRLEEERVHGTYWVPIGLASAIAAGATFLPRWPAAAVSSLCAASIADDLELGRRPLRRVLRQRTATNVVAEFGPPGAAHTLVIHAHHDAAHTGMVFHPKGAQMATRLVGRAMDRWGSAPAPLWGAVAGPALAALGALIDSRRLKALGGLVCAGHAAAMADIARRPAVPGANDNLSGVAVLLQLAERLAQTETRWLRVVLLSTGSEESFLEAMQRFGERHFDELDPNGTAFLCVESVGSPSLMLLDGEGLLRLHRFTPWLTRLLGDLAQAAGIPLREPFRYRLATDGQVPLRAGYPTAVISSMDWYHAPSNYHWLSDRPENLHVATLADAARLAEALVRELDRSRVP